MPAGGTDHRHGLDASIPRPALPPTPRAPHHHRRHRRDQHALHASQHGGAGSPEPRQVAPPAHARVHGRRTHRAAGRETPGRVGSLRYRADASGTTHCGAQKTQNGSLPQTAGESDPVAVTERVQNHTARRFHRRSPLTTPPQLVT